MQNFTPRQYQQIDIASSFGLDKETWQDRLDWFQQNQNNLRALAAQAEDPALYMAGVIAYEDTQKGEPIGHMVSLDATASGLQILSVLTGDRKSASLCNVVDTGDREDAYSNIYQAMLARSGGNASVDKDSVKQAVMTSLYGSKAEPRKAFGEGELLQTFYQTMDSEAPGAWELNKALLDMWDPTAKSYDWVMPDNFHVHSKVMDTVTETVMVSGEYFEVTRKVNAPVKSGRSIGANLVHSIDGMIVRDITRRATVSHTHRAEIRKLCELAQSGACNNLTSTKDDELVLTLWNAYQQSGYLSVRILDHLTGDNFGHVDPAHIIKLLDSLPDSVFHVISVHDCFRVHPNYAQELREQYNLQLAMIASSNLLDFLLSQIFNRQITTTKLDPGLYQDALQADYALS